MSAALDRLHRARTALVLDYPFFGVLALRLHLIEDASIQTLATDGTVLLFNPWFVAALSTAELLGVMAHEVLHCAAGHPWRRQQREPLRWNVACDYAINHVVADARLTLPKGALRSTQFDGKWAEWIYDRVPETKVIAVSVGSGGDEIRDPASGPDAHGQPVEALSESDWQQAVQQVAAAEQMRGTLPAHLARLVGLLGTSRVDWRAVLRRFIQDVSQADYRWSRPNPRHLALGLYLPSMRAEAMGPMAVAIDTSGSIDGVLLTQFASELTSIVHDVQPERVHVAYCDAAIQRVDVFERGDDITLQPRGGGGTDFSPVMDWVETLDETPACLVYLTDLYGAFGRAPSMPVLWATPSQGVPAPYGDIVLVS